MIVPDAFRTNAYRVLRLSVSASVSDVHKAAASMRRAATLGLAGTTEADILALGQLSRSDTEIRAAVGRLANPLHRLSDRLLWFYTLPRSVVQAVQVSPDPAGHDQALHNLFKAAEAGLGNSGIAAWLKALRVWHAVICDDDYWRFVLSHEEQGGFEPAAILSEVEAVRIDALRLAAEPLILAGRAALAAADHGTIRRILVALESLADTGPWAATALEDIASPAVERFEGLCQRTRERYGARIQREQDAASRNKSVCDEALENFRFEIQPALDSVVQMLPDNHAMAHRVREDAALCLSGIASDFTWANDFTLSEQLHEQALTIGRETIGAVRIADRLSRVREAARKQRLRRDLGGTSREVTRHVLRRLAAKLGTTVQAQAERARLAGYKIVDDPRASMAQATIIPSDAQETKIGSVTSSISATGDAFSPASAAPAPTPVEQTPNTSVVREPTATLKAGRQSDVDAVDPRTSQVAHVMEERPMIHLRCFACDRLLRVGQEHAGSRVRCACGIISICPTPVPNAGVPLIPTEQLLAQLSSTDSQTEKGYHEAMTILAELRRRNLSEAEVNRLAPHGMADLLADRPTRAHDSTNRPESVDLQSPKTVRKSAQRQTWRQALGRTLGGNTYGEVRIEERLSQVRGAARKQRVFGTLKPITSAPTMWTLNGFGFRLYGRSDVDSESHSYLATYYLVALFIPVFPIARYRIKHLPWADNRYFLGKAPLRKVDRWHQGIAMLVIVAGILSVVINSEQSPGSSSSVSTNKGSSSGASTSRNSELASLKARIDRGRTQSAALESQLQPVLAQRELFDGRLKALASELKALDEQQKAGVAIVVRDYNAKVKLHNQILEERNRLLAENSGDMQKLKDLLEQDSTFVDEYNGLLKAGGR